MTYAPDGEFLYENPDADSLMWRRQVYALFRYPQVLQNSLDQMQHALRHGLVRGRERTKLEAAFDALAKVWFRWKFMDRVTIGVRGPTVSYIPVDIVVLTRAECDGDALATVEQLSKLESGFTHDDVVAAEVWLESAG